VLGDDLRKMIQAVCCVGALVFVAFLGAYAGQSSQSPQQLPKPIEREQPERHNNIDNSQKEKDNPDSASNLASGTLQIKCDPDCKAEQPGANPRQDPVSSIVNKFREDPIESITAIIAFANCAVALLIFCQIRDTRQSSERQLRAYIVVGEAECVFVPNGNTLGIIRFKNTGQTPAYRMRVYGQANIFDWPLDEGRLTEPEVIPEASSEPLGPLMVRDHHGQAAGASMATLTNGTRALVVWGYAIYNDAFGIERHTYFRFFAGGATRLRSTNAIRDGLVVYQMSAHQNGNDAD
jgi:hypothetical protein